MDNKGIKLGQEIIDIMNNKEQENLISNYPEFEKAIETNEYCGELIRNLTNAQTIKQSIAECGDREQSSDRFLKKLSAAKQHRHNIRLVRTISAIAAALLTVSFIIYYANDEKEIIANYATTPVEQKIKPVIILGNGEKIDLLSSDNKNLRDLAINISGDDSISYSKVMKEDKQIEYNSLVIPSQYTYTITLSDNTKVTLNANSKLTYPVTFKGDKREVTLEGEGYFNVSKSDIPFIVTSNGLSVKVYGTEFNINAYDKNNIETVLISGKVGVSLNNNTQFEEQVLLPNQFISVNNAFGSYVLKSVDTDDYVMWKRGVIKSYNSTLGNLIGKFENWYGIEIEFSDDSKQMLPATASFDLNKSFEDIIPIIEFSLDVKFIKMGGGYMIH